MHTRAFHSPAFLRRVLGTEPFSDYCRLRGLAQTIRDLDRWRHLLSRLPPETQAQIELELTEVHALSGRDGNAHLLAAGGDDLPLTVPGGPALALWFLVHRPAVFAAVSLHHEVRAVRSWRSARIAPGLPTHDVSDKVTQLADRLRSFFAFGASPGPFCAVDTHQIEGTLCITAYIADRLRLIESFTESGQRGVHVRGCDDAAEAKRLLTTKVKELLAGMPRVNAYRSRVGLPPRPLELPDERPPWNAWQFVGRLWAAALERLGVQTPAPQPTPPAPTSAGGTDDVRELLDAFEDGRISRMDLEAELRQRSDSSRARPRRRINPD